MSVKQPRPMEERNGVVYEVPCADCDRIYIGETSRSLKDRVKEHRYAVKTGNMNNGIAAHAWNSEHQVDWEAARIRLQEQHYWRRKVLEAIHIRKTKRTSNLDIGLSINSIWIPVLDYNRL